MKCVELIKEDNNMYMLDNKNSKLDLEDDFVIQKYEKVNKISVINMINEFIASQDNKFKELISDIELLVKKYNIDYFMYGDGAIASDKLSIIYNLNNRKSMIDCILKIFYDVSDHKYAEKITYMIEFSEGSTGNCYGFSFYKYFKHNDFYIIKRELEEYFSNVDNFNGDKMIIDSCTENIVSRLRRYYSE